MSENNAKKENIYTDFTQGFFNYEKANSIDLSKFRISLV